MTKSGYTHVLAVIDRSLSMQTIKSATEEGFNSYVKDQAGQPGECRFTVVQFNHTYGVWIGDSPAAEVPPFRLDPAGNTALYDAIGRGSTDLGTRLSAMPEDDRPEKVVVLILTDGEENSSREYTADTVRELIEHQTEVYSWVFTFLGANQDAILTAGDIGIPMAAAIDYSATSQGTEAVFASASAATTRSRGGLGYSYDAAERAAAGGSGDGGGK